MSGRGIPTGRRDYMITPPPNAASVILKYLYQVTSGRAEYPVPITAVHQTTDVEIAIGQGVLAHLEEHGWITATETKEAVMLTERGVREARGR